MAGGAGVRFFGPRSEVTAPLPSLRRLSRISRVFCWYLVKMFPSGNVLACRDREACDVGPIMNISDTALRPEPTRDVQSHLPSTIAVAIVSPKPSLTKCEGMSNSALFAFFLVNGLLNWISNLPKMSLPKLFLKVFDRAFLR